ncbi:6-carboxytetrahydropterin synthase [Glaciecola sp. MH2013]|uniref:6-carboxytetrahydropterin synthase n=1 Tax=Glaciecola sp. MH2013 TaxID=2785524 RepID=UPI00189F7DEE|nr:6-carboxytetrahydropterin synthase [Glaciecola sp. MH2013]MBF7072713.1 6-carboxytetrahydropterin synthase [Glaciecola sp. MH2013]
MKLFVNDLTVMDFSYLCPRRGMVGESWIVDIILDGGLNEESMVQDFGKVKKELKHVIDEYVDHKLVVPVDCDGTIITHDDSNERVRVDFSYQHNAHSDLASMHLYCPPEAYAFVYATEVTMSSVTRYLKEVIKVHLPENVHEVEILLREEEISTDFYHYTHGLKKHDGNCQRIAHGHRSKVLIEENGEPSQKWQSYWSERWADIYIATAEDLVDESELSFKVDAIHPEQYYCFKYHASQGVFEMAIHKSACEIINTDSTVECLAQFMFDELKLKSDSCFTVRAFEGVGKGAIVSDA